MFYMSDAEYKRKLKKVELKNKSDERKEKLRAKKNKKYSSLSTSKVVLFTMILICLEIIFFAEYAMISMQNLSAMYALIGIPAALVPIVWGYYSKSKAENTVGGIKYETTMAELNSCNPVTDDENSCG